MIPTIPLNGGESQAVFGRRVPSLETFILVLTGIEDVRLAGSAPMTEIKICATPS